MGKGEGADVSSVRLNLTFHCCTAYRASTTVEGCQPACWVTCLQYRHEYNAESPKQGSKRFNSQVRRNTLPIWVYNLSMRITYLSPLRPAEMQYEEPRKDSIVKLYTYTVHIIVYLLKFTVS